jgi:hypothetical protein
MRGASQALNRRAVHPQRAFVDKQGVTEYLRPPAS